MSLTRRHRFKQLPAIDPGLKGDLYQRGADPGILSPLSGPAGHDGYVVAWNDATGLWEARAPGGGGGALSTLSDTNIVTPADADLLQFETSDSKWHNVATVDAAKIGSGILGTARLGSGSPDSSKFLRGDGAWASISGAGGTTPDWVAYNPWNPPASANANDDEFTAGSLGGSWTETITGSVTRDFASTYPSHIYGLITAISSTYKVSRTAPDATATFSQTLIIDVAPQQSAGLHQVLLWAVSSGNDGMFAKLTSNSLILMSEDTGAFNDRQTSTLGQHTRHMIHLQRNASNVWAAWWSHDGRAWVLAGGSTFTKSFTVANVGWQVQTSSGASIYGAGLQFAADSYRYNWKTL